MEYYYKVVSRYDIYPIISDCCNCCFRFRIYHHQDHPLLPPFLGSIFGRKYFIPTQIDTYFTYCFNLFLTHYISYLHSKALGGVFMLFYHLSCDLEHQDLWSMFWLFWHARQGQRVIILYICSPPLYLVGPYLLPLLYFRLGLTFNIKTLLFTRVGCQGSQTCFSL